MLARWRQRRREPRLYIIPSVWGVLFLAMTVVMILTAATYTNNLIFLLAFFLFSLFAISMLQTHDNLRGVEITGPERVEGFADEELDLRFYLSRPDGRQARDLVVRVRGKTLRQVSGEPTHVSERAGAVAEIRVVTDHRGVFAMPEVSLETRFPHGLFRAWGVRKLTGEIVAYPPARGTRDLTHANVRAGQHVATSTVVASEGDFGELVPYRAGDQSTQIAWKQFARTGHLYRKTHWGSTKPHYRLDVASAAESDLEQTSAWVKTAVARGASFEVRGLERTLGPGEGPEFARECWRALARHPGGR